MEELILGELTERKIGYGIVQPGESTIGGIPVIKVNNIISGLKSIQDLDTTHPENDQKYRKTRLNGGEIIISVVGTIGKTAIVPMNFKGCNLVRATALIDIKDPILSRWVKYYIDSPKGQSYINGNLNTTVQPTLNIKSLVEMPIPFYGREYAEKVVTILSKIDDKIENNRKINDNLEQQAQALYKFWFVDFEPFKDGKFEESEIGLIPEGWCVGKAEDFYEINIGKTPPRKEHEWFTLDKSQNIWVSISDLGSDSRFIFDSSEYLTDKAIQKHNIVLVPENTVLLSFKLTIGRVGIAGIQLTTNEAIARFITNSINREYTYFLLKNFNYSKLGSTSSIATAVNSKIIKAMMVLMPNNECLHNFKKLVRPIIDGIKKNEEEILRLTELRDNLLPKLMSGELKINDLDC